MLETRVEFLGWPEETNQWVLDHIKPRQSMEAIITKKNCPTLGHIIRQTESVANALMLGKVEGRQKRRRPAMKWIYTIMAGTETLLEMLKTTAKDCTLWSLSIGLP